MLKRIDDDVAMEEIAKYFRYNKQTGLVTRLSKRGLKLPPKKPQATRNGKLYIAFDLKLKGYRKRAVYAHIIAFVLVQGRFPCNGLCIDHKDGNGTNNKWSNIREVTLSTNQRNRARSKNNTSGFANVHWEPRVKKWYGKFTYGGKQYYTKCFPERQEASIALESLRSDLNG